MIWKTIILASVLLIINMLSACSTGVHITKTKVEPLSVKPVSSITPGNLPTAEITPSTVIDPQPTISASKLDTINQLIDSALKIQFVDGNYDLSQVFTQDYIQEIQQGGFYQRENYPFKIVKDYKNQALLRDGIYFVSFRIADQGGLEYTIHVSLKELSGKILISSYEIDP